MQRLSLRLPFFVLVLLCGPSAALPSVPAGGRLLYVIPEDNMVGEILDSIVADEEVIDSPRVVPENVQYVDYRDLGLSYYRNAGDLLRLLPGAVINTFGPFGNRETVRLSGTNPNQTALLINGVPVGCADYLGFDLHTVPVQNLKRIETVPFGASLTHGTTAPGGAVNLVTRGFSHFLPFYMFGAVMKEDLQDYTGHLHFAQRVYRNINVYISSLLKKNTDENIEYNAVQFNVAVDFYLKDGWEGGFYSFSNNGEQILSQVEDKNSSKAVENLKYDVVPQKEFGHKRFFLSGTPWQGRRTGAVLYTNHARHEYQTDHDRLEWNDWGLHLSQELGAPLPGHRLDASLTFDSRSFTVTDDDIQLSLDTSRTEVETAVRKTGLAFTDRSRLLDLLDFTGRLELGMFLDEDKTRVEVLPAIKLQYRDLEKADLYLTADRTYRQPGPFEQSGLRFYNTAYYAAPVPDTGTVLSSGRVLPENGFNLAAGVRFRPWSSGTVDAGYFLRSTDNAIYWCWPDTFEMGDSLIYLENHDETVHGIFAHGRFSLLHDHLRGLISYTHLVTDGFAVNGRLAPPPADRLSGFVEGRLTINEDKLMHLGLNTAWDVYGAMEHRGWSDEENPWPAKPVLDITLFYNYLYIKTYVRARNILDRAEDTAERSEARTFFGYPPAPFNFQGGISLELGGVYDD